MISSSSLRFAPKGNTAFFLRPTFAAGSVISQQNFSFLGVEKQADFLPLLPFDRKNDDVLFKAKGLIELFILGFVSRKSERTVRKGDFAVKEMLFNGKIEYYFDLVPLFPFAAKGKEIAVASDVFLV